MGPGVRRIDPKAAKRPSGQANEVGKMAGLAGA